MSSVKTHLKGLQHNTSENPSERSTTHRWKPISKVCNTTHHQWKPISEICNTTHHQWKAISRIYNTKQWKPISKVCNTTRHQWKPSSQICNPTHHQWKAISQICNTKHHHWKPISKAHNAEHLTTETYRCSVPFLKLLQTHLQRPSFNLYDEATLLTQDICWYSWHEPACTLHSRHEPVALLTPACTLHSRHEPVALLTPAPTLRRNMAVNCSEMRLKSSWMAVELPMKVEDIFRPRGGMSQTAVFTLLGIHSTK